MLFVALVALSACAGKDIAELRKDADTVSFVQHGSRPLGFSAGVIDTASFWATYGDAVSKKLGGFELIDALAEVSKEQTEALREHNELVVDLMYDEHDLAESVNTTLLADLAAAWGLAFDPEQVIEIPANGVFVDFRDDTLSGMNLNGDLVLMVDVHEVRLTERFTAGSALANGVSLGTNEKSLTVESPVNLRVFRRDSESGELRYVWGRRCGANYTSMSAAYPLDVLWNQPETMTEVLDEARDLSIAHCRKVLSNL
jgi:hypothetical protein